MNALRTTLVFTPVYKDYLWGGHRIPETYGRVGAPSVCAESWEISAHAGGMSVVADGFFAGRRLDDLAATFGAALTGTLTPVPGRFPLLFKLIDAHDRLSVQVHPNSASAASTRGEPKTEMWYVLGHAPGATLFAGFTKGVTPDSLRAALANQAVEPQLARLPVETGQALFIPGGLVHAIGEGCLIYEVQQNSNTTYRLFDWGRAGSDGKPRPLHIGEAFKTIDWSLPSPHMVTPSESGRDSGARWSAVVSCPFFTLRKLDLAAPHKVAMDGTTFHALFVSAGRVNVATDGGSVALNAGSSALIPASADEYTLTPETPATLLITTQ
ncbi:MAG: class I mannose-6-phosphate isomerase [Kiritimatiellae bacterium]|nr:class I mannose-6-phosphate isomerase [Kiritimatiellia bacterium]